LWNSERFGQNLDRYLAAMTVVRVAGARTLEAMHAIVDRG
jgi:hypothetical protein